MSNEMKKQTENIESMRLRAAADIYVSKISDLDELEELQHQIDKRRRELTEGMTSCQQNEKSRF